MNLALDPSRSVSVSASAGSGKTWQLVSRIVRLLLAGAAPGGILALTFTRKAASEMRERVEARLRELAYADDAHLAAALKLLGVEDNPGMRLHARGLHEQLMFEPFGLRAQTLHAFCQDVLTRFSVEAGVPAGFALVENERDLLAEAFENLFDSIRQAPDGRESKALDTLVSLGASESTIRGWLKGFVDRRSDWWAYVDVWQADGEDVVSAARTQLALDLEIDPEDTATPEAAFDDPRFRDGLICLHDLLVEFDGLGALKPDLLSAALTATDATSRGNEAANLLTKKGERRSFKIKKSVSQASFDRCVTLYNALCKLIEDVRELKLRRLTWQRTTAVITLGVALLDALNERLRATNSLSFADLEWKTYQLLRNPDQADWIRYKLDSRLDHLLLDEFQDTNPTQWSLLLPLLAEMAAGDPERARTAFIVGDTKQSIYGFRRANPELMGVAARYLESELNGAEMPLNDSRRSAPAVIDFVNTLFEGAEGAAIGFERHGTWRQQDWGAVEVAPLVRAEVDEALEDAAASAGFRNPLTTPNPLAEDLRLKTEAEQIAARIKSLVQARVPIQDGDRIRQLATGDIMILARQRTHLHAIERALAEAGIPFTGSSKGTLLETVLARDLMALLRFLDAPHRSLELAQVLRSPLFGASDDDLIQLARAREHGFAWWARLRVLVQQGEVSPALEQACNKLENWLAAARTLPAHDLLDRIDFEANAAACYEAALPGDARVRANLGAFLQLVLDADQGRYPTLGRLNVLLAELAEAGKDAPDEAPPPAEGGAVRVMTIHASKGLEAPAVFLVNTAPTASNRNDGWLIEWPSGEARPTSFLLTGRSEERDEVCTALLERQKARDQREALNLLYVAVTRARQYLFVSAFESRRGDAASSWHGIGRAAAERLASVASDAGANEAHRQPLPGALPESMSYRRGVFPQLPEAAAGTVTEALEDARLRKPFAAITTYAAPSFDAEGLRDADSAARGIAIHWLLQQLAEGRAVDPASLPERLATVTGTVPEPDECPAWHAEAERVIAAPTLQKFFDAGSIRRHWNEIPVQMLVSGHDEHSSASSELRGGIIDRLVDDGESLWIIDYKTAPRPQPDAMAQRYRAQLSAYAETVAALWPGRPVIAGLVLTATASWVEILRR